jgi:hypothetical protein
VDHIRGALTLENQNLVSISKMSEQVNVTSLLLSLNFTISQSFKISWKFAFA